ncbi:MAG: hypothetical protein MK554_14630, partial [Planctomycetes bacterium]|nr:hypothetical protein [Planctomycetota bacterium]
MKHIPRAFLLLAVLLVPAAAEAQMEPPMHSFLRADANTDGTVDLSDAVYTFGWLFLGADMPDCLDSVESNFFFYFKLTYVMYTLSF